METVNKLLTFWFGDIGAQGLPDQAHMQAWWQKSDAFDQTIQQQFGDVYAAAQQGAYDHWLETPEGTLAFIILFDQFSRNLFRDTPAAFAEDARALAVAKAAVAKKVDQALLPIQRVFVYLPFEHSESWDDQQQSLQLFDRLRQEVDSGIQATFDNFYDYAVAHARIIERFARYPHRNAILGRESTVEELAFLNEPNSSF